MINPNAELLSKLTHEGHIPGIAACWIQEGIPTQPLVLGCADVEKDIRVTPETRFEAASLSKPVFAYLVLKLVQQGVFNRAGESALSGLDRPLHELVDFGTPEMQAHPYYKLLTVRNILTHSSGLPNSGDSPHFLFEPGTQFGYSGYGYFYLQEIVDKVMQSDLESLAQHFVFGPNALNMKHSSFLRPHGVPFAVGHNAQMQKSQKTPSASDETKAVSAASLCTTPRDFAVFMAAWMNDATLSEAFKFNEKMTMTRDAWAVAEQVPPSDLQQISWGLGWGLQKMADDSIIAFQWGDVGDSKAFAAMNITHKTAIVYLTNSFNGLSIMHAMSTHALGNLSPTMKYLGRKYNYEQCNNPGWFDRLQAPNFDNFGKYELQNEPGWREKMRKHMVITVANKEESGDPHFKNNTFVRAMLKPAVTPAPHDQEDETQQGDLSEAPALLNSRGRNP
jgi:CubicO group peptidase (beta-lactamase class C family)